MALITVSGHLKDNQGNPLASTDVTFDLVNYAPNLPTVSGTNVLVPISTTLTTDNTGFYTGSIQGNDTISPASTLYQVSFGPGALAIYNFIGAGPIALDSYPPVSVIPVPVGPVPTNILTGNNIFSGTNSFTSTGTHSGTETFNGPLNATGNGAVGNVAIKPAVSDSVQYVSINTGNDSNDGLSWGTAKLTIAAAITALNAPITGGGTVNIAAGVYTGGITVPSGVRIFGSGMGATEIIAPNGAAAFDLPAGTNNAQIQDLLISVTHATSTAITIEGNIGLGKFTQFNTIRNVRILGDGQVGEHGLNSQGTSAIGDVSLNRFDTIITEAIDIPFICKYAEGNTWSNIQVATFNYAGNVIAFDATGAYDQFVQLRVTNENSATGGVAYFNDGQRNQVQVYAESDNATQVAIQDAGVQNMYLVTCGKNTVAGTSLTGASGVITNSATVPFVFEFPTGLPGGSPVLELVDSAGTVHAYFNNNGIWNYNDGSNHQGILAVNSLTSSPINWLLPNGSGTLALQSTLTLKKGSGAGNYVHGGDVVYTDVDGSNLALTVTIPTGWKLGINASGQVGTATAIAAASVSLYDSATLIETSVTSQGIGVLEPWALNWVIAGDGNSHTVKLQYKTAVLGDAVTMANSASTITPTMVFTLMPSN